MTLTYLGKNAVASCDLTIQAREERALTIQTPINERETLFLPKACNQKRRE